VDNKEDDGLRDGNGMRPTDNRPVVIVFIARL